MIVYQPLQHDAKACQHEQKRVATVVFYHGDEVLRQWYRRYVLRTRAKQIHSLSGKKAVLSISLKSEQLDASSILGHSTMNRLNLTNTPCSSSSFSLCIIIF